MIHIYYVWNIYNGFNHIKKTKIYKDIFIYCDMYFIESFNYWYSNKALGYTLFDLVFFIYNVYITFIIKKLI